MRVADEPRLAEPPLLATRSRVLLLAEARPLAEDPLRLEEELVLDGVLRPPADDRDADEEADFVLPLDAGLVEDLEAALGADFDAALEAGLEAPLDADLEADLVADLEAVFEAALDAPLREAVLPAALLPAEADLLLEPADLLPPEDLEALLLLPPLAAVLPPPAALFFAGTFAPLSRASDNPMAIACLREVTFLPLLPLFNCPRFISCIASSTFLPAPLEYLAIVWNLGLVNR